jgi:hypothetical protein
MKFEMYFLIPDSSPVFVGLDASRQARMNASCHDNGAIISIPGVNLTMEADI